MATNTHDDWKYSVMSETNGPVEDVERDIRSALPQSQETPRVEDSAAAPGELAPLGPYCRVCGWRSWGKDSWDGSHCKCTAPKSTKGYA